jgi:Protein of unknown function (DUF5672)
MLRLANVTLVAMSSVDTDNTIKALMRSCEGIEYGSVKFISHKKPTNLPATISFCPIEKINSINEYSYNMIYNLDNYIDTRFALTIQADGYAINPSSWRDEFLQYDYIGAPFALPADETSYRDINNNIFRVGNGGFSLRSKKLIELPNKLKLPWKPFHGFYNEDGFICAMNRHIYEANGCKFAPIDVAKYFSHEAEIPEIQGISPFGFHGKRSKYIKPGWLKATIGKITGKG